jgi:hypothetical protein
MPVFAIDGAFLCGESSRQMETRMEQLIAMNAEGSKQHKRFHIRKDNASLFLRHSQGLEGVS